MSNVMAGAGSILIIDPETLFEGDPSGLEKVALDVLPGTEAHVLRYKKGQRIPMHTHTNPTLKVVLQGLLEISDPDGIVGMVRAGDIYPCGLAPYSVLALEETLMLLLQPPRTERVLEDHED